MSVRSSEVVQGMKAFVTQTDDLNSMPRSCENNAVVLVDNLSTSVGRWKAEIRELPSKSMDQAAWSTQINKISFLDNVERGN